MIRLGTYEGEVDDWLKEGGEYPVEYYEFEKNGRFKYYEIFCYVTYFGYGNYEIVGDSIKFLFDFIPRSTVKIEKSDPKTTRNGFLLEVQSDKEIKGWDCNRLNIKFKSLDDKESFHKVLSLNEEIFIPNDRQITKIYVRDMGGCYDEIDFSLDEEDKEQIQTIEVKLAEATRGTSKLSDTLAIKEFFKASDTLIIDGENFFYRNSGSMLSKEIEAPIFEED